MTGLRRKIRAALDAQYQREIDAMRYRYPWTAGYRIQPPARRWYAIAGDSGTVIGPAKNITALNRLILADHQSRPIHTRAVPLPLPEGEGAGYDDKTRADLRIARPYAAGGTRRSPR